MATKDILRAYEGSMAGPSMDAFQNIFQSEARAKGGKYDTGSGFWNMAVQGAEKLDTKIGDWQAAKKSGDENVGDISGLKGFAKYALGSGKGDKYEEWAQIGRGKEGYDERSEKDFSDIALGGIGGAIGGVARIGGDIKKEIGARYEGGRRQREKNRSTVADDRYNAQFGYDEQPMVERQQGTGIMGHLKGGIGKVGEFFRNADFGHDKGMGLGDYEDPTMGYRQGGYIKKYEEGGPVPYEPSEEDRYLMANMQAENREEGRYVMGEDGLMGRFHHSYKTGDDTFGKMTDKEGNLWWKNEKNEQFSYIPKLNIKELPYLERAREDAEYQKRMEGWHDAPLLAEEKPKYEQGGKVPEKDEEGGEKSGWFPEGKFLGRDVPKGAGGLMDMLVMGVSGGGALRKVASKSSMSPKLLAYRAKANDRAKRASDNITRIIKDRSVYEGEYMGLSDKFLINNKKWYKRMLEQADRQIEHGVGGADQVKWREYLDAVVKETRREIKSRGIKNNQPRPVSAQVKDIQARARGQKKGYIDPTPEKDLVGELFPKPKTTMKDWSGKVSTPAIERPRLSYEGGQTMKKVAKKTKMIDNTIEDLEWLRPYQVKGLNPRPKATMKDWSEEFQDISEAASVHGRPQTEKAKLTAIELRDKMNKAYRKMKETNPYWDKLPTKKKAGGGMINGPDHENGGVDIEVEGGEYVIPTNIVEKYGKGFFDLLKEGKL